jgi:uncharacterized protein (DUF2461 family)
MIDILETDAAAQPEPPTEPSGFSGWPPDALAFLAELEQDNSRRFWTENADRYRVALREPTRALAAALTAEFGPPRVFRPHVDRRFRPNADPYRTYVGATVDGPGGTPYAVVLSTRGLAVQVGYQRFDREQLRRYRRAVDGEPGEVLVAVLAALHGDSLVPAEVSALTGRPRTCPRDHPRLPLMRLLGLQVERVWPPGEWLGTGEPLTRVGAAWRAARPLADWLDAHVGRRTEQRGGVPGAEASTEAGRAPADGAGGTDRRDTADHEAPHSAFPGVVDSV